MLVLLSGMLRIPLSSSSLSVCDDLLTSQHVVSTLSVLPLHSTQSGPLQSEEALRVYRLP